MAYTGVSIVDYLKSVGQPTDYASRATLASQRGITGYSGTADQNTQLLNMLRGGSTQGATLNNPATAGQQPPQQQPQTAPGQPGGTQAPQTMSGSPQSIQDLVNMGYGGYVGWNDPVSALNDFRETGGKDKWTGVTGTMGTSGGLNLPDLYKSLYSSSGLTDLEKQLVDMTTRFNEAQSSINDNPFLSEASRVGRIQKLQMDFNNATENINKQIETKKADIEMQINLATKQFDIESQQARNALDQFNSLLESGALNNASATDIASITRQTGLSSTMIQSAINAQKQSNVKTTIMEWDDGTNQGFTVINSDTGAVINKQTVAGSKPTASGTELSQKQDLQKVKDSLIADAQNGATWDDLYNLGKGMFSKEDLYSIYAIYGRYHPTEDDKIADLAKFTE